MTRQGELTIGRFVRDRRVVTPERVAIDFLGDQTTYAQLDDRSEHLAHALVEAGLTRGDRVATLTTNRPEHVEVFFACAKAGLILVPLNPRLAPPELAYQLDDSEPAMFIVLPELDDLADASLAATERAQPQRVVLDRDSLDRFARTRGHALDEPESDVPPASVADGPPASVADGPPASVADGPPASVADDDVLLLIYTSGTTGRPKGAQLTHANCFWTNLSFDRTSDVTTTDVVLQVLPQFHVGGWNVQPLLAWWKGATVVLEPDFDPARALQRIQDRGVTTMMGVPATYQFMAAEPGFAAADLSSLRLAVVGGAPMPEAILRTWSDRDVMLVQGYGLTEAAPNVLCLPPEYATRKLGYAGRPYPHVEVALRDPDSGAWIEGSGIGELCVRGPNVFPGYWHNPDATADAFVDGWLRTGDVAERDADGFYRIRDRVKDMFISGGENVYPAEVESALHDHPAVAEAAVIGIPDDRWGEVGHAYVALRPDATATADDLMDHCRQRLAAYKVPKAVTFIDALPRSSMNKVLKTNLADRVSATPDRKASS